MSRPQTSKNISSLPQLSTVHDPELTTTEEEPMTVSVGKQLIDNYQVTELPDDGSNSVVKFHIFRIQFKY